jgi:hypothetical protein
MKTHEKKLIKALINMIDLLEQWLKPGQLDARPIGGGQSVRERIEEARNCMGVHTMRERGFYHGREKELMAALKRSLEDEKPKRRIRVQPNTTTEWLNGLMDARERRKAKPRKRTR